MCRPTETSYPILIFDIWHKPAFIILSVSDSCLNFDSWPFCQCALGQKIIAQYRVYSVPFLFQLSVTPRHKKTVYTSNNFSHILTFVDKSCRTPVQTKLSDAGYRLKNKKKKKEMKSVPRWPRSSLLCSAERFSSPLGFFNTSALWPWRHNTESCLQERTGQISRDGHNY